MSFRAWGFRIQVLTMSREHHPPKQLFPTTRSTHALLQQRFSAPTASSTPCRTLVLSFFIRGYMEMKECVFMAGSFKRASFEVFCYMDFLICAKSHLATGWCPGLTPYCAPCLHSGKQLASLYDPNRTQ